MSLSTAPTVYPLSAGRSPGPWAASFSGAVGWSTRRYDQPPPGERQGLLGMDVGLGSEIPRGEGDSPEVGRLGSPVGPWHLTARKACVFTSRRSTEGLLRTVVRTQ